MGEGTAPGCLERSADAGAPVGAADAPVGVGAKFAGIDAAMLTLRATRTRKPARSISISVRLVSSSSSASSRISALSSLLNFGADLSSGWRAIILFRNFLADDGPVGQAFALAPIRVARPMIASR